MHATEYAILAVGWIAWLLPFFLAKRNSGSAQIVDRRARWGVVLVAIAYSILWQSRFWEMQFQAWRVGLSVFFFILAPLLSWTSLRALGRQWRIDAGLNANHQLVVSGPYRMVRHPIYTSMLCIILATGSMVAPMLLLVVSVTVFIIGTEIRVRIEDALLAARFGAQFQAYRRRVPAYIPFI
ncbi:MAG TPA: isoprenylcysteine carboxylmethyltransferase family protein [Terriglobia bacterium]|nr:isoprenylcysteine carboxylmethyltransferase family protein [Terriglobia bacterium]